ncbi:unnamed protein product [Aphanomyces euteiches]|uniref:Succinate-semialdehyde dehydrogenase, mitochondrial n=1 Tax=Aphanomyces euteiches TaxID=100861 RepID=A0A6G0XPW8_9STRA|nr:hypothetical protein Ae201684_002720 [Aphanomyces euteiches]KAH9131866.1 hypothetical protein AeRB84_021581 [Aphanomyces euteiches]
MVRASMRSLWRHTEQLQTHSFVGGGWVESISGSTYAVQNPSTGKDLYEVAATDEEDARAAIAVASEAFREWKSRTPFDRSAILQKWEHLLRTNDDFLAHVMACESGKPLAEAKGEVSYAADYLKFFSHEVLRYEGFMIPTHLPGRRLMAMRQPVGVCAMITPWNFPIGMLARKVAPALAAGCTAVVKPAESTPVSALCFAQLGHEAGVPAGVLNILPAPRDTAARIGTVFSTHPDVRKLSFTGSTAVGKHLAAQCASTVKKVSMELGGNAPFIVFDDANIDEAVEGLVQGKFRNTGQTCVCPNRVLVHATIIEEFSSKLVARVAQLKQGNAETSGFPLGPLITTSAVTKVKGLIDQAVTAGANVLIGGEPNSALGPNYMHPTVVADVTMDMDIATQESFGPVVPLLSFSSESEAIALANATESGLAAYCYTKDLGRAWRVSEELEAGMVGVNTGLISAAQAPFGGVKQSGLGREGSIVGLDDYTELKYVAMAGLGA